MGAIAIAAGGRRDLSTQVCDMLTAAPHRGGTRKVRRLGRCAMGVVFDEGRPTDTSVALDSGFIAAVAGTVDECPDADGLASSRPCDDVATRLARAWRVMGSRLPSQMRGTFSAAVSDGRKVWLWRDHLGLGPAFFRREGDTFLAATEAKQVLAGAGLPREADLDVVERITYSSYDEDTPSALRGISRVPKATLLEASEELRAGRYWDPEPILESAAFTPGEVGELFHQLMRQAVARAMTADTAVSLSGGVDSPTVAAYAAEIEQERYGQRLRALTALYPDFPEVDEGVWVRLVARRLGLDLRTYDQQARTLARLDHWMGLFDGPVPTLWIDDVAESYQQARAQGCLTLLTGEFAELVTDLRGGLLAHLLQQRFFGAAARRARDQLVNGVSGVDVARQVVFGLAPAPLRRMVMHRRAARFVLPTPPWVGEARVRQHRRMSADGDQGRWAHLQLSAFAGPGLSVEADNVIQAVAGVSARQPFGDIDLWNFFLSLPAQLKFPNQEGKGLLRQLMRGRVPDEILDRRSKTVFGTATLGRLDYAVLQRWLVDPEVRVPGIDYSLLAEALAARNLDLAGVMWAKDLASAHAFLSTC